MARIARKVKTLLTCTVELEHNEGVEFHRLSDRLERGVMQSFATHRLDTGKPRVLNIDTTPGVQLPLFIENIDTGGRL